MELLLILIAPIGQIILSAMRVKRRINMPLAVIALLSILAGMLLSFLSMQIVQYREVSRNVNGVHCGTLGFAIIVCGNILTIGSALIIVLISTIGFYSNSRSILQLSNNPGNS